MRLSHVLLGTAAAAGVLASPTPNDYVVHERRAVLPRSWTEEKRLDKASILPMRIGLTQSNLDRGHDLLMEMYVTCLNLGVFVVDER
jgi:tripeptidyl-peptidase-1